jgi:hypothetical protein
VVWEAVAKGGEKGEMTAKLAVENILRVWIWLVWWKMADICVETSVLVVGGIVLSSVVCCTEDTSLVVCDDIMWFGAWLWHCDPWDLENYLTDTASHSKRFVSSATLLWENHTACGNLAGNVINNVAVWNFCYHCVVEDNITTKDWTTCWGHRKTPLECCPPHISCSVAFIGLCLCECW